MVSTFFNSAFGFLILIGVLVTIHEFGHFYAARKLGFKVQTFSIGFGKKLWSRKGKDGVEYRIGLIPLGGYVGFLDERAHDVAPSEIGQTFNAKPIWKRAVVIAAGPLINLLFAVVILFGLYLYGVPAYKAVIDTPQVNTPMAIAGFERKDQVIAIEGREIRTSDEMVQGFLEYLGGDGKAEVEVLRDGTQKTLFLELDAPLKLDARENVAEYLGLNAYGFELSSMIGEVVLDGPSDLAGLKKGDEILRINEQEISSWHDILDTMGRLSQSELEAVVVDVTVKRAGELIDFSVPLSRDQEGRFMLQVAALMPTQEMIDAYFKELQTLQKYSLTDAMKYAVIDTYRNSLLIFKFIGRMFTGQVHLNTMAGPLTIANIAGQQLSVGWVEFIKLMALFSVNLGILNLLPIPVLDGGRLVGLGIEAVAGRNRIPARLSMIVMQLGALFLFTFMAFIILFDITKWF
ncbi:RIP metalloprotease RseP [Ignatzschineria rhizosphaerae]|uniref:Zinc metalloprotease n=1 Tax=Ignatzschineria rhizosphaerae TaxID=2923279 RepID=A0ABY3WZX4_9GAMM|nr:RIP metalloprotease RseP [Ignatzschineria rhizosphaerae]UNM95170.1 RIP metalloprotease RseP [Ignatzschineria rhizosphaerae]